MKTAAPAEGAAVQGGIKEEVWEPAYTLPPSSAQHVIPLNSRWRVRLDDPLQFVLEVRKGNARNRASGYLGSAYCVSRTALLRNIHKRAGHVSMAALAQVAALPDLHPGHCARIMEALRAQGGGA